MNRHGAGSNPSISYVFFYILYQKPYQSTIVFKYQNQLPAMSILSHTGGVNFGRSRFVIFCVSFQWGSRSSNRPTARRGWWPQRCPWRVPWPHHEFPHDRPSQIAFQRQNPGQIHHRQTPTHWSDRPFQPTTSDHEPSWTKFDAETRHTELAPWTETEQNEKRSNKRRGYGWTISCCYCTRLISTWNSFFFTQWSKFFTSRGATVYWLFWAIFNEYWLFASGQLGLTWISLLVLSNIYPEIWHGAIVDRISLTHKLKYLFFCVPSFSLRNG